GLLGIRARTRARSWGGAISSGRSRSAPIKRRKARSSSALSSARFFTTELRSPPSIVCLEQRAEPLPEQSQPAVDVALYRPEWAGQRRRGLLVAEPFDQPQHDG